MMNSYWFFSRNFCFTFFFKNFKIFNSYMRSQTWTPLPPPSPQYLSGSSPCTSPKQAAPYIRHGLAIQFLHDSMLFHFLFFSYLFFNFTLFYFTILCWFCHTSTWIRHECTWVPNPEHPSHLPSQTISLGHPSAPVPNILYPASNLDWRFISYMILYMFQCHSPKSSHPLPLPQSPKDCSIHLCLFCCLAYRVIVTIFLNSIYMH